MINRLSQLQIGGDVAYSLGQFEPFTRLTYEYDVAVTEITVVGGWPQPSHDRDGSVFGLGVRYFGAGAHQRQPRVESPAGPRQFRRGYLHAHCPR
ncbi:MAG: hypothetical protein U5P41_13845 [Gammaproteobacteria bacterium]|nr:hypothetical protein [Gammaproteobacteria bacterium]